MGQFLIDRNAISDYLSASLPPLGLQFMDTVIDEAPNLSVISQIELLCWKTTDSIEQQIKDFIAESNVFWVNVDIVEYCVKIRRNKKIKTPDAIIAATALSLGFSLITENESDFAHIQGLKIINPHKI
ncbi:MAG: type II toxin-antitoxin system VapC family toxin [Saprospiraceae bacterium]|nr:type II toxin-antitoxin system VapC family toxin [Saprospiraceae bacterium]